MEKKYFKKMLSGMIAAVMTASLVVGGLCLGKTDVKAADTDEIMLGVFFTSEEDSTDTLYWSTDGLNFYELSRPYVDATPDDMGDNKRIIEYTTQDKAEFKAKHPGATFNRSDVTHHDPSIIYKDGYFWMISGCTVGKTVRIMYGYSKDLERWSYPTNGDKDISITYDGDFDMVAPDIMVDSKGDVYIVFSLGYYAEMHGGTGLEDKMQPYIVKVNKLEVDSSKSNIDVDREPAINVEYSAPIAVKLPCMTKKYDMGSNHIDGSLYEENKTYYFNIKENGVTNEIWSISDLSKAGDDAAWTLVCDDAVTGYEGPSLAKFAGQYFMYTDRLATFVPPDSEEGYGTAGVYVTKASIATTGVLDKYTGWLEANTKAIKLYDTAGKEKSAIDSGKTAQNTHNGSKGGTYNGARHGTVITVKGEAAAKVRALAAKNSSKKDTSNSYKAADWAQDGWYKKESFRNWRLGGYLANYWYEKDVRQGIMPGNPDYRGKEICDNNIKDANGNGSWFWLDAKEDGRMAAAKNTYDEEGNVVSYAYYNGNCEVAQPVDQKLYNQIGSKAYGLEPDTWKWVSYDWQGQMVKCGNDDTNRFYVNGKNGFLYRYDPITGGMVKGVWSFKHGENELFVYFDPVSGVLFNWDAIEKKKIPYEKVTLFTEDNGIWDDGQGGTSNDTPVYRVEINGITVDFNEGGIIIGQSAEDTERIVNALPKIVYRSPVVTTPPENGWYTVGDNKYWYENGVKQGTYEDPKPVIIDGTVRGREICDPNSTITNPNGDWFWLDANNDGAMARNKDVYQISLAGEWGDRTNEKGEKIGKWVRYGADGTMIKGWCAGKGADAVRIDSPDQADGRPVYYFDWTYGTMAKGEAVIDGVSYYFDPGTGILQQ